MTDEKRIYRMKHRAEAELRTRERITESTVELHGTVGPAQTSVSAIARGAGVRRSTVYRHFPDEASLFSACTTAWVGANPFPDAPGWSALEDPDRRVLAALRSLYAHYRHTEAMMSNVLRDEATMPIVKRMLGGYRGYLDLARNVLMEGRTVRGSGRHRVAAAIGHALAFATWKSLAREQGLTDAAAANLMGRLVATATAGQKTTRARGATRLS